MNVKPPIVRPCIFTTENPLANTVYMRSSKNLRDFSSPSNFLHHNQENL